MKIKISFLAFFIIVLNSCSKYYYQIYEIDNITSISKDNNNLVYEDNTCRVNYNFWSEGGNANLYVTNKTEGNIYIDLAASFLVVNGYAYPYFLDRTFSSVSNYKEGSSESKEIVGFDYMGFVQSNKISVQSSTGKQKGVTYKEQRIICIPPSSTRIIYANNEIVNGYYENCDLKNKPNPESGMSFSILNTPLNFSTFISISNKEIKAYLIKNSFFVNKISNYKKNKIEGTRNKEKCGKKTDEIETYFINVSPNKFYVKYN